MTSLPNDFTKMSEQELQAFIAEHPDIDLNAKLSSRYFRDLTPIQIAIRARNSELVSVLLSHNVDLSYIFKLQKEMKEDVQIVFGCLHIVQVQYQSC